MRYGDMTTHGIIWMLFGFLYATLWYVRDIEEGRRLAFTIILTISSIGWLLFGVYSYSFRLRLITDPLTLVYNRNHLMPQLGRFLAKAKRTGSHLSVAIVDLDKFKQYNDTLGHLAGDKLLQTVASCLKEMTRRSDVVARYGGDEFVLLLPDTDAPGALALLNRIKVHLATKLTHIADMTLSAGVATYPYDGDSSESLLRRADKALYQAKEERNCIQHVSYEECKGQGQVILDH